MDNALRVPSGMECLPRFSDIRNSTTLRNLVQKHSPTMLVRDLLGASRPTPHH
ncbi:MAG: hypothetical protein HQM08_28955 [Candidatus Riflebacteria bacterium]|nr:hypothetical protein [Candidatus Riflebacteria bacterium]